MPHDVTQLLDAYNNEGDTSALDRLAQLLYVELKHIARSRSRDSKDLSATTLVNETFLKLLAGKRLKAANRKQFFALSATIMRQIVIDEIRYRRAAKRDGLNVTFADTITPDASSETADYLLQVDEALGIMAGEDARLTRVFECRFFAGMSIVETAESLGVSTRMAERLWSQARTRMGEIVGADDFG